MIRQIVRCDIPVLAGFTKKYPGIQLELYEDSSAKLNTRLQRRELDLTFSCAPEIVEQSEHRPAFYDHILLAVHQDFPLPGELDTPGLSAEDILMRRHLEPDCPKVDLKLFRDAEFILLREGNNLHNRSNQMFREAGFSPKIKMTISQMVTSYRLADNGIGAVFISDRLVRSRHSHLRFFRLNSGYTDRLFYFLLPMRNYTPFAVHRFIEYAAANIPQQGFQMD